MLFSQGLRLHQPDRLKARVRRLLFRPWAGWFLKPWLCHWSRTRGWTGASSASVVELESLLSAPGWFVTTALASDLTSVFLDFGALAGSAGRLVSLGSFGLLNANEWVQPHFRPSSSCTPRF